MKLYTCDQCRYTFLYPLKAQACPDCGREAVRPATEKETDDYNCMQEILQEEIRLGLYAAG